jgi:hypothetical protein
MKSRTDLPVSLVVLLEVFYLLHNNNNNNNNNNTCGYDRPPFPLVPTVLLVDLLFLQ